MAVFVVSLVVDGLCMKYWVAYSEGSTVGNSNWEICKDSE